MLRAGSEIAEGEVRVGWAHEDHSRSEDRGVAGGSDTVDGEREETDAAGAGAVDVIAEGAGEVNRLPLIREAVGLAGEEVESGSNGSLGELQFPHIALEETDGIRQGQRGTEGEASVGGDGTEIQGDGDGVDQTAPADPPGLSAAEDLAGECAIPKGHTGDGPGGGAHAHGDPGAFEGGAGRRGGAEEALRVADDDFAIGTEVDERGGLRAVGKAGGDNAGEDVAADEPAEAREEGDGGPWGGEVIVPAKFREGKGLGFGVGGGEGMMGEGVDGKSGEEVVHHRVADEEDFLDGGGVSLVGDEVAHEVADLLAEEVGQGAGFVGAGGELDSAHDVGAMAGLGVEGGADGEDMSGQTVDQLGDEGGGADIDGDAEAVPGRALVARIVIKDQGLPLGNFEGEVQRGGQPAGQAPAQGQFLGAEQGAIFGGGFRVTRGDADAAASATAVSSAGEFDPGGEKGIAEGGSFGHLEAMPGGFQADGDKGAGVRGRDHGKNILLRGCGGMVEAPSASPWAEGQHPFRRLMSQHRSLRSASTLGAKRNVLKRFERVELLRKRGQWKEGDRVNGLRKTKPAE